MPGQCFKIDETHERSTTSDLDLELKIESVPFQISASHNSWQSNLMIPPSSLFKYHTSSPRIRKCGYLVFTEAPPWWICWTWFHVTFLHAVPVCINIQICLCDAEWFGLSTTLGAFQRDFICFNHHFGYSHFCLSSWLHVHCSCIHNIYPCFPPIYLSLVDAKSTPLQLIRSNSPNQLIV